MIVELRGHRGIMNQRIYCLTSIIRYLKDNLVDCITHFPNQIILASFTPRARTLQFLGIAILTSLLLIVLAQLNMAPVRSQIINLPEAAQQQPSLDITQAGNLDIGKVRLDGKLLLQVAAPTPNAPERSSSSSPIERRVKAIQFHLSDIIHDGFDPDTLKVTPSSLNNQTVIVASDKDWGPRLLLTVTALDVNISPTQNIDKLAEKWSQAIEQALLQAWKQRQPAYQREQIPIVLAILAVIVVGNFGIKMLQKFRGAIHQKLKQQLRELEATESNPNEPIPAPTPGNEASLQPPQELPKYGLGRYLPQLTLEQEIAINLIVRKVLFAAQVVIWYGGMAIIFQRFPQTYALGSWLLRVPLAYIGIPLGITILKSVVDTIIQSNIKRIADRLVESGNGDVRLRPRARTILLVLEELTEYLAWVLGFLLFFYIINALHIILIALGAIAFVAQNVLQDFLKTYFIIVEDQYALGDWIQIGDVNGQVEKISLRASQVRARCGDLFTIAHGSFTKVTNFSHHYSGIHLYIDVAYSTDLDLAIATIEQVAKEMQQDSLWGQYITAVKMKGVETFGDNSITIHLILNTKPGQQWDVGWEYRRRLKPAFDQASIEIPFPQRSVWFKNGIKIEKMN